MHYTVMVAIDKEETGNIERIVEQKLAPFSEHIEVEPYISHTAEEVKEKQKEVQHKLKEDKESRFYKEHEELIMNSSPIEFAKEWYGGEVDEEGNVYKTYNPKSQWDWYVIGGRWSGLLTNKDGSQVDYGKVKEIDWQKMRDNSLKSAEETWKEVQESEEMPFHLIFSGFNPEMSKEEFIDMHSAFSTFAVLTKQGEWFDRDMDDLKDSWDKDFKKNYIDMLDAEDTIVIVDCHI